MNPFAFIAVFGLPSHTSKKKFEKIEKHAQSKQFNIAPASEKGAGCACRRRATRALSASCASREPVQHIDAVQRSRHIVCCTSWVASMNVTTDKACTLDDRIEGFRCPAPKRRRRRRLLLLLLLLLSLERSRIRSSLQPGQSQRDRSLP